MIRWPLSWPKKKTACNFLRGDRGGGKNKMANGKLNHAWTGSLMNFIKSVSLNQTERSTARSLFSSTVLYSKIRLILRSTGDCSSHIFTAEGKRKSSAINTNNNEKIFMVWDLRACSQPKWWFYCFTLWSMKMLSDTITEACCAIRPGRNPSGDSCRFRAGCTGTIDSLHYFRFHPYISAWYSLHPSKFSMRAEIRYGILGNEM